ncbi:MAG: hypothetical protein HC897_18155 [Thermoanaerobaculia bacterium]|nr:hypothetical protein [Thermoanaerobaculia bacterium]
MNRAIVRRASLLPLLLAFTFAGPLAAGSAPHTAAQIVDAMITAHGGMERWASAPTVTIEDEFIPAGAESGSRSVVTVEQGPRRAYIDFPGTEMRMAWDGERAWSENWAVPYPPRFLALLNYYFVNLPWMAKDPGVILGEPGTARLWDDPTDYVTVKMTYGEGVGDTPGDYYTLFIDPKTHRLEACEYIVTYKAILPEGLTQTPPHVLVFEDFATVDGLVVPTRYTVYQADRSVFASSKIHRWSFREPFDTARMTPPAGAVFDESQP